MTTLEKIALGFTWALLVMGAVLSGAPFFFGLPLVPLSAFIANRWVKGRTYSRALAKGVIRIERESNSCSALSVGRELPFPITKDDYSNLQSAIGHLANWMDSPVNLAKYPVIFYFKGYYRLLASKHEFDDLVSELQRKYRELS